MGEIDEVIESYGGWPGAFNADSVGPTDHEQKGESADAQRSVGSYDDEAGAPDRLPGRPFDGDGRASDHAVDDDDVMCAIRHAFASSGAVDRPVAIETVARELDRGQLTPAIHQELDDAIRRAVRRGVLTSEHGRIAPGPSFLGDHDRDFLKDQFIASLRGHAWAEREDAIRAFARWMGFRRTGPSIDEVSRSLINGLIRDGRLESDGPSIRST